MSSPPNVPYQAYRSKRHSRTVTPSNIHLVPNVSPPPISRPTSLYSPSPTPTPLVSTPEKEKKDEWKPSSVPSNGAPISNGELERPEITHKSSKSLGGEGYPTPPPVPPPKVEPEHEPASVPLPAEEPHTEPSTPSEPAPAPAVASETPTPTPIAFPSTSTHTNGQAANPTPEPIAGPSTPISPPQSPSPSITPLPRKASSFRHVPRRTPSAASRTPLPSSPLRTVGALGGSERPSSIIGTPRSRIVSLAEEPELERERAPSSPAPVSVQPAPYIPHQRTHSLLASTSQAPAQPPSPQPATSQNHSPSPSITASPSLGPTPSTTPIPSSSSQPPGSRNSSKPTPTPYRPGFQPKGVYRPHTDAFLILRSKARDEGRVERTKLERRLEKIVTLHFSGNGNGNAASNGASSMAVRGERKRTSSMFSVESLSGLRDLDPGQLWKGVLTSQVVGGAKADIRAAEQRITPWQPDNLVSSCPLCNAGFHPLTNRKHHCRLCGQIICSLPPKKPQRPVSCSVLFVVDPKTRKIEEVGEGVDYGVRKRTSSMGGKGDKGAAAGAEEEKFLKGVRICRECKPVLIRQQYHQEVVHVSTFARLHEAFIKQEKEIEDTLPQFQELILSLSNDDQPTKEASAARKRLLEAFAQYDALAKRIRKIPCPEGKGSSQDRVQAAIVMRANLFLQKNMFPLQSLPKPKPKSTKSPQADEPPVIDPDSATMHALQPLLEQEALLESFVEEAKARRKFEDARTLKKNLGEIRAEIDRMVGGADIGMGKR